MATHVSRASALRRLPVPALMAASLVLVGCSAESDPDTAAAPAPASPAATPSDSATTDEPTPAEPESPDTPEEFDPYAGWENIELPERGETIDETDLEGAKDTARTMLQNYWNGLQSGDTQPVIAMSDHDCGICKQYVAEIQNRTAAGQTLTPNFSWTIEEMFAGKPSDIPKGGHFIVMRISWDEELFIDTSGQEVDSNPAKDTNLGMFIRRDESGWMLSSLGELSDEEYENVLPLMQEER